MPGESELHIQLDGGYKIVRVPAKSDDKHWTPATYVVHRPDGSELCRGVHWPDVERAVEWDLARGRRE
jgi:hypothetical protein